jgi:hypothetical protein
VRLDHLLSKEIMLTVVYNEVSADFSGRRRCALASTRWLSCFKTGLSHWDGFW